jgi:hypothetical protein
MTEYAGTEFNFFLRARMRAQRAIVYVGEITDLAGQTIQQIRRGPLEKKLIIAQF